VVVQQIVPVQVPVVVPVQQIPVVTLEESGAQIMPVAAGLPYNWGRVRVARSSYPREAPRPPHLTLLVLKDETIIPARDYWLEDGRVFYITSTGRQKACNRWRSRQRRRKKSCRVRVSAWTPK
jgi:hypothetical protein